MGGGSLLLSGFFVSVHVEKQESAAAESIFSCDSPSGRRRVQGREVRGEDGEKVYREKRGAERVRRYPF